MELKEFVKNSIVQITQGIIEAQNTVENGCQVSPRHVPMQRDANTHIEYMGDSLEWVDFDIAVTTESIIQADAKAKIFVASANAGTQWENALSSRIKFRIFVQWPRPNKQ